MHHCNTTSLSRLEGSFKRGLQMRPSFAELQRIHPLGNWQASISQAVSQFKGCILPKSTYLWICWAVKDPTGGSFATQQKKYRFLDRIWNGTGSECSLKSMQDQKHVPLNFSLWMQDCHRKPTSVLWVPNSALFSYKKKWKPYTGQVKVDCIRGVVKSISTCKIGSCLVNSDISLRTVDKTTASINVKYLLTSCLSGIS